MIKYIYNKYISNIIDKKDNYLYYNNLYISGGGIHDDDNSNNEKTGIYRIKYEDKNDIDKNGNPKIKFKYYYSKNNKLVSNDDQIRINKLAIPPAYTDVWISCDPDSKIQGTGLDSRGRKQYRYNKTYIIESENQKFIKLYKFIKLMPKFENTINLDIKKPIYSKERTIALMFNIIKLLNIRVGKEIYAKTNKSYGICSLKKTHVKIINNTIKLNFKAKSNKRVNYTIKDINIVNDIKYLLKLDGKNLFQFINNNIINKINDIDLNCYLRKNMGNNLTVKYFRTYSANLYFIESLLKETKLHKPDNIKIIKKNLSKAQEYTAFYLRHTKSISKKSYVLDLIRNIYIENPDFFLKNINKKPLLLLIKILKLYKKNLKIN